MQDWNDKKEFDIIVGEQTPKVSDFEMPVKEWIKENSLLLQEFIFFSASYPTALGVAANQVAWKGKRLMHRFFSHKNEDGACWPFEIIVDPVIVKKYGEPVRELEGCLCWPKMTTVAKRWVKIDVTYYDIDGNYHEKTLNKEEGQVWQHEMDHLDGVEEKFVRGTVKVGEKIGRNDPCPCGRVDENGKSVKYKKCCMK